MIHRVFGAAAATALAAALAAVAAPVGMPVDPGTLLADPGELRNQGAISLFPMDGSSIDGCRAHLASELEMETEYVLDCQEWVLPPVTGVPMRAWLEGDDAISPYPGRFTPEIGSSLFQVLLPLPVPAGRVRLPNQAARSGVVLRLLDAKPSPMPVDKLPLEMFKSVTPERWEEGVLMPAGAAVGWLWDSERHVVLALSQPFEVLAGGASSVVWSRPTGRSHLMAVLDREKSASEGPGEISIVLRGSGWKRPPDWKVETYFRIYAFWYDLPEGPAELSAESRTSLLPLQRLQLKPGTIDRVDQSLVRRPELEVEVVLPPELAGESLSLRIVRCDDHKEVGIRSLARGQRRDVVGGLPAALLEVEVSTGFGAFRGRVDLSDATDARMRLEPKLVVVTGKVLLDGEGHAAEVRFSSVHGGEPLVASADENGDYQLITFESLRFVEVNLENGQAPQVDFFVRPIDSSRILDFHLESRLFEAKILDSKTRKPIPRGQVRLRNTFIPDSSGEGSSRPGATTPSKKKIVVQSAQADENGVALLPQLRPGELELSALAEGYRPSEPPAKFQILDTDRERTFEVLLDSVGPTDKWVIVRPDGMPAVGAELLLVASLTGGDELFSGKSDSEGEAKIPEVAGYLLVRHPETAVLITPWPRRGEPRLSLPPKTELLVLKVENVERRPMPGAAVALWIDQFKIGGSLLSWIVGGRPLTDPDGFLRVSNLPPAPLRALAWARTQFEPANLGALDSQATAIPFPWSMPVVLQGVE